MQESTHLGEHPAFRIYAHIAASAVFIRAGLQNLRSEPEAGFARTGRADHTGVKVADVGRVFWAGVYSKKLCPGQNDVVFKLRIDKRLDVFFGAP